MYYYLHFKFVNTTKGNKDQICRPKCLFDTLIFKAYNKCILKIYLEFIKATNNFNCTAKKLFKLHNCYFAWLFVSFLELTIVVKI